MCPYLNIARGMGGWGSSARARSPPYHKHCQQQNVECSHDLSFNHIQNNAFLFSVKVLRYAEKFEPEHAPPHCTSPAQAAEPEAHYTLALL